MAKKNKKLTKINQRIKKYFDDDPFDVGVERVDTQTLSELMHTLGVYDVTYEKEQLLRRIRKIWSSADSFVRSEILAFFSAHNTIYKSNTPKKQDTHKLEKIEELLEEFELTKEEYAELQKALMQTKTKNLTPEKVEKKLQYIRYEFKRSELEKRLDGRFLHNNAFEFNASLAYAIFEAHFYKIVTLKTQPYDTEFLDTQDIEKIFETIVKDKEQLIAKKQQELDNFLKTITLPHTYLTKEEILKALRTTLPTAPLNAPLLSEAVLTKVLQQTLPLVALTLHHNDIVLELQEEFTLPHSQKKQPYILELHLSLEPLLKTIWQQKKIDLTREIEEAKQLTQEHFLEELQKIVNHCKHSATVLTLKEEELYEKIYIHLQELLGNSLTITPKIAKKTVKRFIYHIQEALMKKQRHLLLARTIRDFKNLFPLARELKRKLILHIGPTNSGKTYQAMQKLQNADTGYYLAPLRLLALEGYETLKAQNLDVSLITGEEQIVNEEATHISSTIEMLNFDVDVDVCVIDEVQMIDDSDRGWAWANAIIGAPAKEVIMTGSANAKEAIIALAKYLGEELEIVEFERKTPLSLLEQPTPLEEVEPSTAVIAFSRKDVLKLKQKLSKTFHVSVVYGNLSPEVRREEARRFREGETQVLVATDAIAMGMNLPIKTILFSKAIKFDGKKDRTLTPSEIAQISGRAGRYGLEEAGFVGAINYETLRTIKNNFNKPLKKISIPFKVMANLEHIKLVSTILEENSLFEVLQFFVKNMQFSGPFKAANLGDILEAATIVDNYDLDIATKYHLANAPLSLKSPYIVSVYENYLVALERKEPITYNPPKLQGEFAQTSQDLLHAEDMIKEISLYLWLSYRFKEYFIDEQKARSYRGIINKYIEKTLQESKLAKRCKICHVILPADYKYDICESCYRKNYKRNGRRRHRR